ncbi:MAG: polyprenol monophosphomannose synthase [Anaerolineaceae bacterium]|nr:polyprenol monophosphomannose synthase [Anaerolineaceae bacterium]
MKTTFVIPTYNEAENIPKLVKAVMELPVAINLLIVDDNSPDGSGDLAEQMKKEHPGRIQVLHRKGKLGLGSAYIQGFRQAMAEGADFIGQMDADFSHPIDKIPVLMDNLSTSDFVIGSRYVPGGKLDDNWPFWRKWLSGFGNFYARTILGLKIKDVTGGFRLWRKETLSAMPLERVKSNGYIFQVEMSYLATLLGFQCAETPIYFADRRWGQSKMSLRIQLEAAYRTWLLLGFYTDLKRG